MNVRNMLCWQANDQSNGVFFDFTEIVLEAMLGQLQIGEVSSPGQRETRLKLLPADSVLRIATAPETYTCTVQAVRGKKTEFLEFLQSAISAESLRLGQSIDNTVGVWSALGDCYFPAKPASELPPQYKTRAWEEDCAFQSPRLDDSIVVDFFSPYARRDLPVAAFRPVRFGPYTSYCSSEIAAILQKLESAAAMLKEINPVTASFVRLFAKTVMPRKETLNPDFFTSSSCNAYIGRIVLINPHLGYVDESTLIDALVHESIHSLLWRVEMLNPFIVDPSKVQGTTRSPWTGSELHLYTFLQACFVWFGLLTFWSTPKARQIFPDTLVSKYVARARKGFEENRVVANVFKFKEALRPGLLSELESMQAQACSVN